MFIILVLVITIPVTQPHPEKFVFCIYLTEDKDSNLARNVDGLTVLSCSRTPTPTHTHIFWAPCLSRLLFCLCSDSSKDNSQAFGPRRPKAGWVQHEYFPGHFLFSRCHLLGCVQTFPYTEIVSSTDFGAYLAPGLPNKCSMGPHQLNRILHCRVGPVSYKTPLSLLYLPLGWAIGHPTCLKGYFYQLKLLKYIVYFIYQRWEFLRMTVFKKWNESPKHFLPRLSIVCSFLHTLFWNFRFYGSFLIFPCPG